MDIVANRNSTLWFAYHALVTLVVFSVLVVGVHCFPPLGIDRKDMTGGNDLLRDTLLLLVWTLTGLCL